MPLIAVATGLLCVALLFVKVCLADKSQQAVARQTATLISTSEVQTNILNKFDKSALATKYFEPFLLLLLGATLLAIGTSIKRLAGAEAKTHLSGGKSKRPL